MYVPGDDASKIDALRDGPRLKIYTEAGRPVRAHIQDLVCAPAASVWALIEDAQNLGNLVRMIDRVTVLGEEPTGRLVRVDLKFKISLFAAKFYFTALAETHEDRILELHFREGKVKDIHIRLEVIPVDDISCILDCESGFDTMSLGWLVKVFLRHHPEIEWGVHSGSVLTLTSSIREAAEVQAGTSAT